MIIAMEDLERAAREYINSSEANTISKEIALIPDVVGLRIYDAPCFACGSADDPLFLKLCEPEIVGPHHLLPKDWLETARSVISVFLPFSEAVRTANNTDYDFPAAHWLHARIQGQELLNAFIIYLSDFIRGQGHECLIPSLDPRFSTGGHDAEPERFTSNWSERHVAYACGHGTFGLSAGLITGSGVAGRFGSLVTDRAIPATEKHYSDPYDYCIKCGSCALHCPVNAISLESGKNHALCSAFLDTTQKPPPYYGCGKCQVGVPCETSPAARRDLH